MILAALLGLSIGLMWLGYTTSFRSSDLLYNIGIAGWLACSVFVTIAAVFALAGGVLL